MDDQTNNPGGVVPSDPNQGQPEPTTPPAEPTVPSMPTEPAPETGQNTPAPFPGDQSGISEEPDQPTGGPVMPEPSAPASEQGGDAPVV